MKQFLFQLSFLILAPFFINAQTVVDIVVNSDVHNTLEVAVTEAELVETLQGDGPFTLFAPTDAAFDALPAGVLDGLLADPTGALQDILLYHTVAAEALSTDLTDGQTVVSIEGSDIRISIDGDNLFINNALVTTKDIDAENGVVHVVDAVLLPYPENVVDVVLSSPDHTTLATAVAAAGLVETLQGDGPFTLFAPTDDAFDALPAGLLQTLLDDPSGALSNALLYHVVSGSEEQAADLEDGTILVSAEGSEIRVTRSGGDVFINNAKVTFADILTDNGVVHVIDAVILPYPENVVEVVINSDIHNTLETAVIAAGLVETLQGEGPFTLFAPTDAAFDALPDGVLQSLLDDPSGALTDILLYHAVAGDAQSTDLADGQRITTVAGRDIRVKIEDDKVFINDAEVIVANILTDNGVVHVIDAVLQPYPATVVDVVIASEDHNTLESLVIAADLVETLQGEGPFTLFAPTDEAFAKLDAALVTELTDAPDTKLREVLLYHAISGSEVFAEDLSDGQTATTAQGQDITVTITDGNVFINEAQVVTTDIITDNGIVHVITDVLLPEGVVSNENQQFDNFSFTPNPVSDFLSIDLGEIIDSKASISIYNSVGQLMLNNEVTTENFTIDMTQYNTGNYFIKIASAKKASTVSVIKL